MKSRGSVSFHAFFAKSFASSSSLSRRKKKKIIAVVLSPWFCNRLLRSRTAVGSSESPPLWRVRRVRRIYRSRCPCDSPTIGRRRSAARRGSTAASGGTTGLSPCSISSRTWSAFFIKRWSLCYILPRSPRWSVRQRQIVLWYYKPKRKLLFERKYKYVGNDGRV